MSNLSDFLGGSPSVWVSGGTYSAAKVVLSTVDFCYYVNKTGTNTATDPSSDTTNWQNTNGIKSIQRGTASATPITISAVNVAKTELRWLGGVTSTSAVIDGVPTIYLSSSTQISVSFAGTSKSVAWELTERY